MFVQVIHGIVRDTAAVKAAVDRWARDLAPGAPGWLGSTGGVTEDGRLIAFVRFESEQAAEANSKRPEQDAWWADMSTLFASEPTFAESANIMVDLRGNLDDAGFVQIMKGRTTNAERARELMSDDSIDFSAYRPDILGTVVAVHDEGAYTMAAYFTSVAEARAAEKQQPPADVEAAMAEMNALEVGEPEFFDLNDPWLHSPA